MGQSSSKPGKSYGMYQRQSPAFVQPSAYASTMPTTGYYGATPASVYQPTSSSGTVYGKPKRRMSKRQAKRLMQEQPIYAPSSAMPVSTSNVGYGSTLGGYSTLAPSVAASPYAASAGGYATPSSMGASAGGGYQPSPSLGAAYQTYGSSPSGYTTAAPATTVAYGPTYGGTQASSQGSGKMRGYWDRTMGRFQGRPPSGQPMYAAAAPAAGPSYTYHQPMSPQAQPAFGRAYGTGQPSSTYAAPTAATQGAYSRPAATTKPAEYDQRSRYYQEEAGTAVSQSSGPLVTTTYGAQQGAQPASYGAQSGTVAQQPSWGPKRYVMTTSYGNPSSQGTVSTGQPIGQPLGGVMTEPAIQTGWETPSPMSGASSPWAQQATSGATSSGEDLVEVTEITATSMAFVPAGSTPTAMAT